MLGMFQIYLTMCVVDTELIKLIVLKQQMKSKEYRSSIDRRELMPLVHDKWWVHSFLKAYSNSVQEKKNILKQLMVLDWFYTSMMLSF
jgi:hypothetical protein